jgi:hypothetical protein
LKWTRSLGSRAELMQVFSGIEIDYSVES